MHLTDHFAILYILHDVLLKSVKSGESRAPKSGAKSKTSSLSITDHALVGLLSAYRMCATVDNDDAQSSAAAYLQLSA